MNSIERHQLNATLAFTYGSDRGTAKMFYDWVKPNAHPEAVRYIEEVLASRAA
jgi:hypothetical protein